MNNPEEKDPSTKQPQFCSKNGLVFGGGSSSSGFFIWKSPKKENSPGGVSCDQTGLCSPYSQLQSAFCSQLTLKNS